MTVVEICCPNCGSPSVVKRGNEYCCNHCGRHTINACWHAHGYFFEALLSLNPKAIIKTALAAITKENGNWTDREIGSIMQPRYFSEACKCEA